MEYLVEGKKNLYYYRDKRGKHFLIDHAQDTVIELPYSDEPVYRDGKVYLNQTNLHQAYLREYFADCPELSSKIDQVTIPGFNDLIRVTKKYHELTCGDSGCIVYRQKKNNIGMGTEYKVSLFKIREDASIYFQYSMDLQFWLPRASERLYLITGAGFVPIEQDGKNYLLIRVPIKMEYNFPKGIIRPKFNTGVNFIPYIELPDKTMWLYFTFSASAGIYVVPAEFLLLDFSLESDLWGATLEKSSFLLSYFLNVGVLFRF